MSTRRQAEVDPWVRHPDPKIPQREGEDGIGHYYRQKQEESWHWLERLKLPGLSERDRKYIESKLEAARYVGD